MSVTPLEIVEALRVDRPDLEIYHEQTGGALMCISVTQRARTLTGEDLTIYIGNGNGPIGWSSFDGDMWGTWHDIVIPAWNHEPKIRERVALDLSDRIRSLIAEKMPPFTGRYQIVIGVEELDHDGHPMPDLIDSAVITIADGEEEADRMMQAIMAGVMDLDLDVKV